MSLTIKLPDEDPAAGYELDVKLHGGPVDPLVVHATAAGTTAAPAAGRPSYLYGRGQGSRASEDVHIVLRISRETIAAARAAGTHAIELTATNLDGSQANDSVLNVATVTFRPYTPSP